MVAILNFIDIIPLKKKLLQLAAILKHAAIGPMLDIHVGSIFTSFGNTFGDK